MADPINDSKVISKKNEGFPEWLDFDKLRMEGMDYLGELSGKIWTDHNVHDPGITILEMLCYAILDLGYRTSLPPADLFARNPDDGSPENNFFTPAQILGCNPLTILDYRKLLVDIEGVKNAWLTVAEDITAENICNRGETWPANRYGEPECIHFLNGLYHVYIDLEDDVTDDQKEKVRDKVREALMAHRNLCEDFFDITILCKQDIGVCAEIELDPSTDLETAFFAIIDALCEFFSPSPKFYRLKQLLSKNKLIEEIFEGRPFDMAASHGFVDVAEFEKMELLKEIHLSDVYNIIFGVPGVAALKNLRIRNCDASYCDDRDLNDWVFRIFKNHVPRFSLDCSGFHFTRNGVDLIFDIRKYKDYRRFRFSNNGKRLLQGNSPYLDLPIPVGNYRKDLSEYLPIENDFPKVYGIAEGSLPDDVQPPRRAQALQLKGYLLFFDMLLAGYLSQLKNLRSLFSLSRDPAGHEHTYFINQLPESTDLKKLLSLPTGNAQSGTVLASPVSKLKLEEFITNGQITDCDIEKKIHPWLFTSAIERDIAVKQFMEDFTNENFTEYLIQNTKGCWNFYLEGSGARIVILGKEQYKTEQDARMAMVSLEYLLATGESYRKYSLHKQARFSFDVRSNARNYWDYLQLLTEDEKLYLERRDGFLNHLLARFAETFTDYAMLSYSFLEGPALGHSIIENKQKFLTAYPELSSTRGKAYNYAGNGWNNNNVSGFQKRIGAYAGMEEVKQENYCHFEVVRYEELSVIKLAWNEKTLFSGKQGFDNRAEAGEGLHVLLDSLKDPANYDLSYSQAENKYSLNVKAGDHVFSNPGSFTEPEGRQAIQQFRRMFSTEPVNEDIQPSQFRHEILLEKKTGGLKWHRKDPVINREKDFIPGPGLISDFADTKKWIADQEETTARSMDFKSNPDKANELLDAGDLRPYQNHVDVREGTEIIQYTLSDEHKTFFFISEQEFEEEAAANQALLKLMFLLPDSGNYYTEEMKENGFYVRIRKGGKIIATDTIECGSSDLAKEAITRISQYFTERIYALQQVTTEYQWQYTFRLGAPGLGDFPFRSAREYGSPEDAHKEAAAMVKVPDGYSVAWGNNHELQLKSKKSPAGVIATYTPGTPVADPEELSKSAADLLNMKRTLNKIILEPNSPEAGAMIIRDPVTEDGDYGYRLVRKDGYHAWYTLDGDFSDWSDRTQKIKQVYKLFEAPPAYLEICYGGDNINERKDAVSGVIWYHYLVKSIKDEFILFESTKGYTSPEDAQQAFTSEYARILTLATDPAEYGKSIGFDEVVLHDTDSCTPPARLVFIPEVTMKTFAYNHDAARDKLVALAISYPIRIIRKSDPLFVEYFGCISDPEPPADDCGCGCAKEEIDYYYYHYGRAIGDSPEWISQKYYDSPAEAHKAFHFFLVLLRYKGNYFICTDECNCHWKLYLREILAESVRRFPDRETAWGEKGVQKFICVAQSGHAFHAYQREVDCCFTFNVACSNSGLVHPCTYDTADKRDKALAKLIAASRELYDSVLKNNSGLFADTSHYIGNIRQGNSPCSSNDYIKKMIYLDRSYPAAMVASAADMKMVDLYKSLDLPDKEKVLSGAHYFPVSRKKLDIPGQDVYKYFLDIRLPGFCEDDLSEPQPVNCDNPAGETVCCCSAWVSECCFDTCEEALRYYYSILPCLIERDHYISTFECECGPYGIQFYCDCETHRREPNDPVIPSEPGQPLPATTPEIPVPLAYIRTGQNIRHCCNEIVAINPQCYTTPKMVCDAIDRAKGLINAEGLHLVEHILLRPHCIDGDCNCPIPICDAYEDCRFKWPVLSDDACDKDKQYCFVPGADPYSFVATVVLPAWPERFRRKENRALISQMLYREMPSHILLRVLWVSPRDMCRFEALYHNWVKWLAHKMVCGDHNPPCELIDFLFRHKDYIWECFVCNECIPCDESSSPPDPCDFKAQHQPDPNEYVNAINRLYCWPYICPQPRQIYQGPAMEIAAAAGEPAVPEEAGEGMALDKEFDAERKIDERFHGYKVEATAIAKNSGNATAAQAIAFLNDPSPHFKNYRDLVERIAANKRHAEGKIFTATQKQTLVRLVTWYYLDQSVLNGQVEEHKTGIKTVFDHLRRNKLLPEYRQWEGKDIMRIKPEMPAGTIKKLFG